MDVPREMNVENTDSSKATVESAVAAVTGRQRFSLVLVDAGSFPDSRLASLLRPSDHVHVMDDRGLASKVEALGCTVTSSTKKHEGIGEAISEAAERNAAIILTGAPKHSKKWLNNLISASIRASEAGTPLVSVNVLRAEHDPEGPVHAVAEEPFVTGYAALMAVGMGAIGDRDVHVVVPSTEHVHVRHDEVLRMARGLADEEGVNISVKTDPSPVDWALAHEQETPVTVVGIVHAPAGHGHRAATSEKDEGSAPPLRLLKEGTGDVIMVLDGVTLSRGETVGLRVAKAVGTGVLAAGAMSAVAGPAAAATTVASSAEPVAVATQDAPGASMNSSGAVEDVAQARGTPHESASQDWPTQSWQGPTTEAPLIEIDAYLDGPNPTVTERPTQQTQTPQAQIPQTQIPQSLTPLMPQTPPQTTPPQGQAPVGQRRVPTHRELANLSHASKATPDQDGATLPSQTANSTATDSGGDGGEGQKSGSGSVAFTGAEGQKSGSGSVAFTGAEDGVLAAGATALIAAGAGLVAASRRRKRDEDDPGEGAAEDLAPQG